MKTQVVIDTMKLAYQYLGKAVADGELANCAKPVESAFKQVGLVLAELESEYCESGIVKPSPTGSELIAQERERQMSVEGWDDTTNPHLCRCAKYEGVDCGNVPDDVSSCPDFELGHIPEVCHDDPYEVHKQIKG